MRFAVAALSLHSIQTDVTNKISNPSNGLPVQVEIFVACEDVPIVTT